jgi:hypothetical protein
MLALLYTMSEQNLFRNYVQLITGAENCLAQNLAVPALVLIYTAIDSVSWIASADENQPVGKRFRNWVDKWMLQKHPLPCTAEELYAARCGILHTLTPLSNLTKQKGVRQIAYVWGNAKQKDLEDSIKILEYPGLVAVHVDDIFSSFRNGFADFIGMLENDPKQKKLFEEKAKKHFAITKISLVEEFLASAKKGGG